MRDPDGFALNRRFPPHPRDWLRYHPSCKDRLEDVLDCDEFPFAATQQGGEAANPPVSLRVLDAVQNRAQGTKHQIFHSTPGCDVAPGDGFWVAPLPELPGTVRHLPTVASCDSALTPVP